MQKRYIKTTLSLLTHLLSCSVCFTYSGPVAAQESLLDEDLSRLRSHAFPTATKATYKSQLRASLRFCLYFGYTAVPCTPSTVLGYTAFLARTLSPSSIPNYLIVIRIIDLQNGFPNPLQDPLLNWRYHLLLRGIQRQHGRPTKQKLPITPQVLRSIRSRLNMNLLADAPFWAAFLVAFFSFFRKSNLLPPSIVGFNQDCHLRRKDIFLCSWGVILVVRWSKPIQFRQKQLLIPLPKLSQPDLCPLTALRQAFQFTSSADPEGPAFVYAKDTRYVPYTYDSFTTKLKQVLESSGLSADKYSGHSFRRGGATFAMKAGVPHNLIQAQGDWNSKAYERYLDNSFVYRLQTVATMAAHIT